MADENGVKGLGYQATQAGMPLTERLNLGAAVAAVRAGVLRAGLVFQVCEKERAVLSAVLDGAKWCQDQTAAGWSDDPPPAQVCEASCRILGRFDILFWFVFGHD